MTLYAQRCEQDASYPMKRQSFAPEIEYMYYDAQRKGKFHGVDPNEIRVETTKTSADENRSAAEACRSLVPRLRQEYMRHVSFRHFQGHLMNAEQVSAANFAINQIATQLKSEQVPVPTFEECVQFMQHKHQVAIQEQELLHAARMPPPKRRATEFLEVKEEKKTEWNVSESQALPEAEQASKRCRIEGTGAPTADVEMSVDKDQPPCPMPPHMMSSSSSMGPAS